MNKPLGVQLEGTIYNVNNIASFAKVTNQATKQEFISITFINTINGQHGVNIAYNKDEWKKLCYSFDYVSTAYGS